MYERESTRQKRASEVSVGERKNKLMVNSSFNAHQSGHYLTPQQVIRGTHNLTINELQ
jgi:hypothetical protein